MTCTLRMCTLWVCTLRMCTFCCSFTLSSAGTEPRRRVCSIHPSDRLLHKSSSKGRGRAWAGQGPNYPSKQDLSEQTLNCPVTDQPAAAAAARTLQHADAAARWRHLWTHQTGSCQNATATRFFSQWPRRQTRSGPKHSGILGCIWSTFSASIWMKGENPKFFKLAHQRFRDPNFVLEEPGAGTRAGLNRRAMKTWIQLFHILSVSRFKDSGSFFGNKMICFPPFALYNLDVQPLFHRSRT